MKIGVIADTHVPRHQGCLPTKVQRAFAGVDIILHVGDVCTLDVLRQLQNSFTITLAVSGERDDQAVRQYLETRRVVEFANRRIGLIHGHATQPAPWWRRLLDRGTSRAEETVRQQVLGAFEGVHCVVYGHTHRPYVKMHGSVLLFNPGPAAPIDGQRPSVGLLDMGGRTIIGRIIYLDEI